MPVLIGTSGWNYPDWRGSFYPRDLPERRWLAFYAERFSTVELNGSFYRLPTNEQFRSWAASVPDGFVFAVKVSRYLSHVKRLRSPAEPVDRFLAAASGLGSKLGPALLQLPPTLTVDVDRLAGVLAAWPTADHRLVVEFRHDSWFCEPVRALLTEHQVALCVTDRRNRSAEPPWTTTSWGYVRLHEGVARPAPSYGPTAIRGWVDRIESRWDGTRSYLFFNNDQRGCAPRNAAQAVRAARRSTTPRARRR
jgi:uncharacterized protein YecE (DUF72 family)